MTAAETGHLVFATLHTQDAPQTIDRIIDVFPPHQQEQIRVQLANTLQGVCTQQLLPDARRRADERRHARCSIPTPAVRNLIREGKTHQIYSVMQTGSAHGMQTMDCCARRPGARRHSSRSNVAFERCSQPRGARAHPRSAEGTADPASGAGGARPQGR